MVDLAPEAFHRYHARSAAAQTAAAAQAGRMSHRAAGIEAALRVGPYANFTRLVFEFGKSDVAYTVFPGAGKLTVRFQALARPDSVGDRALSSRPG